MRVGVFGGTFDPPHIGHAIVASEVLAAARLGRVLWVPASIPPHKGGRRITPGHVRRRMVEAAIQGEPRFELCDLELERGGVSYTVDTLRALKRQHPDWSLSLIVGADLYRGFERWRSPGEIAELAEVIVVTRPGSDFSAEERDGGAGVRIVPIAALEISSSRVRERVGRNLAVRDMVAPAVLTIIEGEGLYGSVRRRPGERDGGRDSPEMSRLRKEKRKKQ